MKKWSERLRVNMPKEFNERKEVEKVNQLQEERTKLCLELGQQTYVEEVARARKLQLSQKILDVSNKIAEMQKAPPEEEEKQQQQQAAAAEIKPQEELRADTTESEIPVPML